MSAPTPAPLSAPPAAVPPRFPRPLSLAEAHELPESAYAGPVPVRVDRPSRARIPHFYRNGPDAPTCGWFLFFQDRCCGWFRDFTSVRMEAWRPGVIAIAQNPADSRVFLAVGGDYQGGAKRFLFIDPVGF